MTIPMGRLDVITVSRNGQLAPLSNIPTFLFIIRFHYRLFFCPVELHVLFHGLLIDLDIIRRVTQYSHVILVCFSWLSFFLLVSFVCTYTCSIGSKK